MLSTWIYDLVDIQEVFGCPGKQVQACPSYILLSGFASFIVRHILTNLKRPKWCTISKKIYQNQFWGSVCPGSQRPLNRPLDLFFIIPTKIEGGLSRFRPGPLNLWSTWLSRLWVGVPKTAFLSPQGCHVWVGSFHRRVSGHLLNSFQASCHQALLRLFLEILVSVSALPRNLAVSVVVGKVAGLKTGESRTKNGINHAIPFYWLVIRYPTCDGLWFDRKPQFNFQVIQNDLFTP